MDDKRIAELTQIEFVKLRLAHQLKFLIILFEWLRYQKIGLPIQADNSLATHPF